jgi:hypothetical protein
MDVSAFANYGKGFGELTADRRIAKRVSKIMTGPMLRMLWREVGPFGMFKFMRRTNGEVRRMKAHDWSAIKSRGLCSQPLLELMLQSTASMRVLADMVGMERAKKALGQLMEDTAFERVGAMFVPVERFLECEDPFAGFREYIRAFNDATAREGVQEIRMKEDTDAVFAFDITYCAWHQMAKAFGDPELCYPSCYNDEAFYPKAGAQLGYRFTRTGTLVSGAPACDYRFERI